MGKATSRLIMQLWGLQIGLLALATGILWWFDSVLGYSSLIGGLIYWIPNAYFTLYAFRYRGAQAAAAVLSSIYRGEIGKFILTIIGFGLVFTLVNPLNPLALFIAYIGMTLSQWILVSRWA